MVQQPNLLCDARDEAKASQLDADSVKDQKAPCKKVLSSMPWGLDEMLSPASDNTTCYAKSQLTRNNWLSPTSPRSAKGLSKV